MREPITCRGLSEWLLLLLLRSSTWDGSSEPEVHAEPLEAQIPFWSNIIIKDCKFKTFGCGAAVATSSMATELVMGKTIYEALLFLLYFSLSNPALHRIFLYKIFIQRRHTAQTFNRHLNMIYHEALEVTNKAVMEALDGLPPVKVHCSLLAEEAIHAALLRLSKASHFT